MRQSHHNKSIFKFGLPPSDWEEVPGRVPFYQWKGHKGGIFALFL